MRGNVVELAVAVVVGTAFTNIVNAVVKGVINPLIGALGTQDLDAYESCLRGPCEVNEAGEVVSGIPIRWGTVISASLTFLITAAVVYFLMILPINRYQERRKARAEAQAEAQAEAPAEPTQLEVLIEIRDALRAQRPTAEAGDATAAIVAQRTGSDESAAENRP
ncbi:MscL family protein [Streptomyces sp. 6N223]|uniref:MscL family protein n=1 Tax=Streptomyces sp. 6N223 TaxID=3457412 RepID=UPI003FD47704